MNIKLEIQCEEKDEPFPGALPLRPEIVASRLRDILADVTKHDELLAWRVTDVRIAADTRPTDFDGSRNLTRKLTQIFAGQGAEGGKGDFLFLFTLACVRAQEGR